MKTFLLLIGTLLFLTSCSVNYAYSPPPLIEPVAARAVLEAAEPAANVSLYRGLTRVHSVALYFHETWGLPFGGFLHLPGSAIQEGEPLAILDTARLRAQIEDMEERIHMTGRRQFFELETLRLNIRYAYLRHGDAQVQELLLRQAMERHELYMRHLTQDLERLYERLQTAVIHSPIDGYVTLLADINPGGFVASHAPVVFVSDKQEVFVEFAEAVSVTTLRDAELIVGKINGAIYELQLIPIPREEMLLFNIRGITPIRSLKPISLCGAEPMLSPGSYVSIRIYGRQR